MFKDESVLEFIITKLLSSHENDFLFPWLQKHGLVFYGLMRMRVYSNNAQTELSLEFIPSLYSVAILLCAIFYRLQLMSLSLTVAGCMLSYESVLL